MVLGGEGGGSAGASAASKERGPAWLTGRVARQGVAQVVAWRGERFCQRTAILDSGFDTTALVPQRPLLCSWCFQALELSRGGAPSVP